MINTHNELLGLAERVEGATDRELDARVWCALNGKRYVSHFGRHDGTLGVEFREPPKRTSIVTRKPLPLVTSSIDAAMSLAEGLEKFGGAPGMLREAMDRLGLYVQGEARCWPMDKPYREYLARFFTAACLRAHASLREGTGR